MHKPHMGPASNIITICGGVAIVAQWTGLNRTSVLRWTHPKERGGTGGIIPAKHQAELLRRAKAAGKRLFPSDFFAADVAA